MSDADKIDWYDEVFDNEFRIGLAVKERLFEGQSDYQKVEVFETVRYGRALAIDSVFMTSEADEHLYHEMLVHPAMLTVDSPRRVLVIGGGDGGTVREVLRHPEVEQVLMVEIDAMVVDASKKHLGSIGTAWDHPKLEVRIADGIGYVKDSTDEPYDVILLDGTDPVGPAKGLFNIDFYKGVRRMLRPGGVFALQSEGPLIMPEIFRDIQLTLGEVFPNVHPYFGPVILYGAGLWSWTYATDMRDHMVPDESRARRLESGMKTYNTDLHRAAFVQPNYVRSLLRE